MRRKKITLIEIAEWNNLNLAIYKAAKGKRNRRDVVCFFENLDNKLAQLADDIRQAKLPYGKYREFKIYDPKQRIIHAACFEDRIFHHAMMNKAGNVLEKAMLLTSYACRSNMGIHKAAKVVQQHIRSYPWYCKIDIKSYFANIDHHLLHDVLMRRFKGGEIDQQLWRILSSYQIEEGKGLPIGSLTSQYFANYFLDGLDRLLDNHPLVLAHIRYMDDCVWWCEDKQTAKRVLNLVRDYLWQERLLTVKQNVQIQKSKQGIVFCGYRIFAGTVRMSLRRKRRYQQRRMYWEAVYQAGLIDGNQLQNAYAAVHAITQGTDSRAWINKNLELHPPPIV